MLEQAVPQWDTQRAKAFLDIGYLDKHRGQRYLDIAVIAGGTHAAVPVATRLERHARAKRQSYPGAALIPVIIDVRGALGKEALARLKEIKPQIQAPDKEAAMAFLKWRLASSIQGSIADAVLRSTTSTRRERGTPAPRAITRPSEGDQTAVVGAQPTNAPQL